MTSRTCAAVTSASSSSGPRRTASSTAVQEVRPGSSAATTEYGHPGIICACPLPRPYTWQNSRSGLVTAPGRSQLLTSTASISRPSAARGNGNPASDRRSRAISTRPLLTASYKAPWPRRCPGASDSAASDSTSAAPSCKLSITAFAGDLCPLARTNDHAKAVLTHRDTPGHPAKATRNAQVTAVEVKEQA